MSYPLVPLGDVLQERREVPSFADVASGAIPVVAKIGFNDGRLQLRPDFRTQTGMILIRPGDLVVSGINAAKGAIAVFDERNRSPIAATTHYAAYVPLQSSVNVTYLWWLLRSEVFRTELLRHLPDGIKTELKPSRLLRIPVPLPPRGEQERAVARIDELAAKIGEARGLRQAAIEEAAAFVASIHRRLSRDRLVTLCDILALDERQVAVEFGRAYPQAGVKGFGGGLFAKDSVEGSQTTYRVFNRLYPGALVLSQVKGWEGAIAVCPPELEGRFVSPEYRTFRCLPAAAIPEYLSALVATPWFWERLGGVTRGMGGRRERTRPEQFLRVELPMPPLERQQEAVPALKRLTIVKRLQEESAAELEAMLPAVLERAFRGELG